MVRAAKSPIAQTLAHDRSNVEGTLCTATARKCRWAVDE